jgi:hypothetical protein
MFGDNLGLYIRPLSLFFNLIRTSLPSRCLFIQVRHEQWTCLEMWNGPMATRAPGASSLALSSSPFAGLPRLHRTLSELEVAPTPPPNDEDAYLKPLTEKDFQV